MNKYEQLIKIESIYNYINVCIYVPILLKKKEISTNYSGPE